MKITECIGSFNQDTSEFEGNETDITLFLAPCLNSNTRRGYSIFLDLSNVVADRKFDKLTVRAKSCVDGVNYRTFFKTLLPKRDLEPADEPVVIIEIPPSSLSHRITLTMKTPLEEDAIIHFCVGRTHLE